MATFLWSSYGASASITFNPAVDVFLVDDALLNAAETTFSFSTSHTGTSTLTIGGKAITFSTPFSSLTSTNITFQNGSLLLIGDNLPTTGAGDDAPNTLTGTAGADAFSGLGGADTLNGGDGNDAFYITFNTSAIGNDIINGGNGSDRLVYNSGSTAAVSVNLTESVLGGISAHTATNSQGTLSLTSIEYVFGTAGNDVFYGGDTAHATDTLGNRISERFRGNGGNDTINGRFGGTPLGNSYYTIADYSNNTVVQAVVANLSLVSSQVNDGRGGTDTLTNVDAIWGGEGNDVLTGGSASRGSSGFFFEEFRGNGGNDTFDGNNAGTGGTSISFDAVDYSTNSAAQAITVDFVNGTVLDGRGGTDTLIDIDYITGGLGNDSFTGGAGNETIDGHGGNDVINGGGGRDTARFQTGTMGIIVNLSAASITVNSVTVAANSVRDGFGSTDTLVSIEAIDGSDFDDYIRGSDDPNVRESFRGFGGNNTIDGGAGIDYVSYSTTHTDLSGVTAHLANGSGTISNPFGGIDTVTNIEGLGGTNLADVLTGGAGTQWFAGHGGSDSINGGADVDWVSYATDHAGVMVNLAGQTATDGMNGPGGLLALGGTDTLVDIENVEGSEFDDIIDGDGMANVLVGRGGADTLNGGVGADTMVGGLGNDIYIVDNVGDIVTELSGEGTADEVRSSAAFFALGSEVENFTGLGTGSIVAQGNGMVNVMVGSATGYSTIYGGGGSDFITGGNFEDVLVGDAGDDNISGGAGGDIISELFDPTNSGNDTLDGGNGVDIIYAASGNDIVSGGTDTANNYANLGTGNDSYAGSAGSDVVVGGDGVDTISGNSGDDSLYGEGDDDTINGGAGIDLLSGSDGNDTLNGGADNDLLIGDAGNDILSGDAGIDVLYGFADNDILNGGAGTDGLYGGAGADDFRYLSNAAGAVDYDYIWDFTGGAGASDRLVFGTSVFANQAAVLAASSFSGGNTTITMGNGNFVVIVGVNINTLSGDDFSFV